MKKYDYIVFGANLYGLTAALYLKKQGASILLLNYYGFPGGSISESLNCVQRSPVTPYTTAEMIFNRIDEDIDGIQGREGQLAFLNPESVKYTVQRILVEAQIDLLFHVNPVSLAEKEIILLGREGYITYNAEHFIDCSENYALYSMLPDVQKEISGIFLNLIISGLKPENEGIISEISTRKFVLNNNRIWYNFQLQNTELNGIENMAQLKINSISEELMKYSARIQIVPARSQVRFKLINPGSANNIYYSDLIINHEYFLDEDFLKAEQLEHCLNDRGI